MKLALKGPVVVNLDVTWTMPLIRPSVKMSLTPLNTKQLVVSFYFVLFVDVSAENQSDLEFVKYRVCETQDFCLLLLYQSSHHPEWTNIISRWIYEAVIKGLSCNWTDGSLERSKVITGRGRHWIISGELISVLFDTSFLNFYFICHFLIYHSHFHFLLCLLALRDRDFLDVMSLLFIKLNQPHEIKCTLIQLGFNDRQYYLLFKIETSNTYLYLCILTLF